MQNECAQSSASGRMLPGAQAGPWQCCLSPVSGRNVSEGPGLQEVTPSFPQGALLCGTAAG